MITALTAIMPEAFAKGTVFAVSVLLFWKEHRLRGVCQTVHSLRCKYCLFSIRMKHNFKGSKIAALRLEKRAIIMNFFHNLVTFTKEEPVSPAAGFKS